MPRLAVFVACSDLLFDDQTSPTMVGVFAALDALPPPDGEIQLNAMSPKPWIVCTMWLADEKELGKTYTQKIKIFTPDGIGFGEGAESFVMNTRSHTVRINVNGMPVGRQGNVLVNVWLELDGEKVTDTRKYEINILHRKRATT